MYATQTANDNTEEWSVDYIDHVIKKAMRAE